MKPRRIQIRECINPDCRTRYPMIEGARFGSRCPRCLGATRIVKEQAISSRSTPTAPTNVAHRRLEALLDNVRSGLNVGSMFRSAEGLGLRRLYLAGITPTPEAAAVRKTSLGAETQVDWSQHNNGLDLAIQLKQEGHAIWALEKVPGAISVEDVSTLSDDAPSPVLVVGNEVSGVDPAILELADYALCLPMQGAKESFNVAVAFALAAYALTCGRVAS